MDLTKKHCVPCEEGGIPMNEEQENEMLKQVQHDNGGWTLIKDGTHKITRQFKFKNFKKAMEFVNKIADLAESEGHHPDIKIVYNKVRLELFTHAFGGLSENDFVMAAKINALLKES